MEQKNTKLVEQESEMSRENKGSQDDQSNRERQQVASTPDLVECTSKQETEVRRAPTYMEYLRQLVRNRSSQNIRLAYKDPNVPIPSNTIIIKPRESRTRISRTVPFPISDSMPQLTSNINYQLERMSNNCKRHPKPEPTYEELVNAAKKNKKIHRELEKFLLNLVELLDKREKNLNNGSGDCGAALPTQNESSSGATYGPYEPTLPLDIAEIRTVPSVLDLARTCLLFVQKNLGIIDKIHKLTKEVEILTRERDEANQRLFYTNAFLKQFQEYQREHYPKFNEAFPILPGLSRFMNANFTPNNTVFISSFFSYCSRCTNEVATQTRFKK